MLSIPSISLSQEDDKQREIQFGYGLDLDLAYIDELSNTFSKNSIEPMSRRVEASTTSRTLGLRRARFAPWWVLPYQSRLDLVLRPDAIGDEGEQRREFDARSGPVYRDRPKIQLLDAYYFTAMVGSLDLSVGVFEEIASRQWAFEPLLEFGLEAQLPQRFAAVRGGWQQYKRPPETPDSVPPSGYGIEVFVLTGDQDRAEVREESSETFDKTPTAKDSHYGVAMSLSRVDGSRNVAKLLVGYGDNDFEVEDESTGEKFTLKQSEIYGQLSNDLKFDLFEVPLRFALDLRVISESWSQENDAPDSLDRDKRIHYSGSFSANAMVVDEGWILAGTSYGASRLTEGVEARGLQFDFGYRQKPSAGDVFADAGGRGAERPLL